MAVFMVAAAMPFSAFAGETAQPQLESGAAPAEGLPSSGGPAGEPQGAAMNIVETEIDADPVINYEGYASIRLNGVGEEIVDTYTETLTYSVRGPMYALADREGDLPFPYQEDVLSQNETMKQRGKRRRFEVDLP